MWGRGLGVGHGPEVRTGAGASLRRAEAGMLWLGRDGKAAVLNSSVSLTGN